MSVTPNTTYPAFGQIQPIKHNVDVSEITDRNIMSWLWKRIWQRTLTSQEWKILIYSKTRDKLERLIQKHTMKAKQYDLEIREIEQLFEGENSIDNRLKREVRTMVKELKLSDTPLNRRFVSRQYQKFQNEINNIYNYRTSLKYNKQSLSDEEKTIRRLWVILENVNQIISNMLSARTHMEAHIACNDIIQSDREEALQETIDAHDAFQYDNEVMQEYNNQLRAASEAIEKKMNVSMSAGEFDKYLDSLFEDDCPEQGNPQSQSSNT